MTKESGDPNAFGFVLKDDTAKVQRDVGHITGFLPFVGNTRNITIRIIEDTLDEDDEVFLVELRPQGGTASTHRITIEDNDPEPTIGLSLTRGAVEEGDGNKITAGATLSAASGKTVTVDYQTVDGSAQSPGDYAENSGTLTFASGETTKDIKVTVADDTDKELPETFDIELTSATNATLGTSKSVTATITQPSSERIPADCATSEADLDLTRTTSGSSATIAGADFKEGGQANFVFLAQNEGPLASRCAGTPVRLNYEIGAMSDEATFGTDYTVEVNNAAVTNRTGSLLFTSTRRQHAITIKSVAESPPAREVLETMTLILKDPDRLDISGTSGYQSATMSLGYIVGFQDASPAPDLEIRAMTGGHSVAENGGTYNFPVELKANPWIVEDVTVECDTADGTATAGEDYTALTRHVLTFQPGELTSGTSLTKYCPIEIADDALDEAAETLTLEISAPTGGATIGDASTDSDTLTIREDPSDPAPVATISATPVTISEGRGTYAFDVTLDAPTGRDKLLVGYRLSGTAAIGRTEDYYVSTSGLGADSSRGQFEIIRGAEISHIINGVFTIIGPGAQFVVVINNDTVDEQNETIVLELDQSTSMHATVGSSSAHTVRIEDNDDPPSVSLDVSRVGEDAGQATFTAILSEASGRVATVAYETSNGTARAGTDYSSATGTLTFAKGDTRETFTIDIADNAREDGDRAFQVALSSPNGTAEASTHAVTIEDDESLPRVMLTPAKIGEGDDKVTFTASLAGRASGDVTVEWQTRNGTAASGEDYAAASGTLKFTTATANPTLEVRITDDALNENDETFRIEFSSADGTARASAHEVTIADDDPLPELGLTVDRTSVDEGGKVVATATLTPASGRQISVGAVVEDGTATGRDREVSGLTGGRLTFAKGDATETFDVDIVDDPLNELAETFTIRLTNPEGATLGTQVSSVVTIASDGSDPEPSVAFARAEAEVREGEGRLDVEARLSAESGRRVTVDYATADATGQNAAVAGDDYRAASGTLTFEPGQTARSFPLEVEADGLEEEAETLDVALSGPVGATLGRPSGMRVTILDGDDPILAPIANYLSARVESLLAQQPSLTGILRGESPSDSTPGFSLSASDDGTRAEGGFAGGRVWGTATGVWSSRDGAERRHLLGTLGAHAELSDDLMLGGMLQIDSVSGDLSGTAGEIRGSGWMAGPYFVANGASGRLRFEGRLLHGRSSNEISGFVSQANRPARDGSFDGERWLAMAGVEGEYRLGNGAVMLPSADLGHAREIAEGFRDGLGREVEGQRSALTRLRLGATLEIPVEAARGDLTLRPGLRFVATDEDGGLYGESDIGAEGRIDFGVDYRLDGNVALEFDGFYSGIGRRDRESYGAGIGLRMDF